MSERIKKLANAVIHNKEASDLNEMVKHFENEADKSPNIAQKILEAIFREKDRQNPKGKFDEEEYIIGQIESKKK